MASGSFKAIIESFFQRNGGMDRLKGGLAVYYWPRVAGHEIANKVTAVRFADGYIYLQTDNAALAHQISLLNLDNIKKYRQILGSNIIKGIKIKIGSIQLKRDQKKECTPELKMNSEDENRIAQCGQSIEDPVLAAKFTDLMKKHYLYKRRMETNGANKCRACGTFIETDFEYCPCCERLVTAEKKEYLNYLNRNENKLQ